MLKTSGLIAIALLFGSSAKRQPPNLFSPKEWSSEAIFDEMVICFSEMKGRPEAASIGETAIVALCGCKTDAARARRGGETTLEDHEKCALSVYRRTRAK